MQKIRGKGVELLRGLDQPAQDGIGIDLEHPRRVSDAQPLGQTRDDTHDELHQGTLAVKDRAIGFREIALAGDALQLAPGLAAGMTVRADVAAAEPAMVGTIQLGTEVCVHVDRPSATSSERDHGRWRAAGRLASCLGPLRTGLAERFVEEPSEGLWLFGAFSPGLIGLE